MNIAAYSKYDSFKYSGFNWVGYIPVHWNVEKLGSMLNAVSEKNQPELPLLSITREQGVIKRDIEDQDSNHNFIPDDLSGYKVLRKGQFGMNKMKAWQGSYGVSAHTGIVSPAYFIFDFTREVDPHFFNIAIRSKLYVSYFGSASDGVRIGQWDLNQPRMRQIPLILPPLPEQRAIAAFLDNKSAKIDQAVRIKEAQIKLLRERRQILIQQAVTRGLNPDVPMKDSGIDWIGEIPAHWKVHRNFALFREIKQPGNADLPVLSVSIHSGVSKEELSEEENIRSIVKIENRSSYMEVLPGDIAYNMMRAWQGGIGAVHTHGMVSPAYVVARPVDYLAGDYFELLYRTPNFIRQMDAASKGIADFRKRLYWDDFRDLMTTLPPLAEQKEIIQYSEQISEKVSYAISIKQDQIATLKEYKTSLINAAVTGKIKVS
ncbi:MULTISPECIES: restriction endonuclease subunit S [unclassified Halomonas]|uniref:restriction endonuclease subunit S n=1 Tax=unclassified Halomonas TaxID=2609666 RepID=UPI0009BD09D5|nr:MULTISPECIES: restriction endonuclease subunit S [unclassified Halomonas]